MWDLIVLILAHCLSFYFSLHLYIKCFYWIKGLSLFYIYTLREADCNIKHWMETENFIFYSNFHGLKLLTKEERW